MPYSVYVLRSQTTGKRYIGQTDDLQRRLAEHNNADHNPGKYTSRHCGPWELVYVEEFATRAAGMRRERSLKGGQGRAWLNAHVHRAGPPAM